MHDKGKTAERRRRKATGPVKWQPATECGVFFLHLFLGFGAFFPGSDTIPAVLAGGRAGSSGNPNNAFSGLYDKGKTVERRRRKATGPVKWQPATE
jgi:hypothetical protein